MTVYWASILEGRQREYRRNAKRFGDQDYIDLRRFILSALGDASAYQKVESKQKTAYQQINARVEKSMRSLYQTGLQSRSKPLIVLAHGNYWTDNNFTKPVTKFIASFL